MTPPEAAENPGVAVLDAYLAWVAALFGQEEVAALRALASEKGAFLEPETWVVKLQAAFAELMFRKPLTSEELARAYPLLARAQQLMAAPSEYDRQLLQTEPGASFLAFLHAALDRVGAETFMAASEAADSLGWHNLIVPGLGRDLEPVSKSFEAAAKVTAEAIRNGVEGMYKPLLHVALAMTPTRKGDPTLLRASVPDEVGKVVKQCRDAWTGPGDPVGVLDDDLVLMRNSVAHVATKYDVIAKTVTFVNKSGDNVKVLGPLELSAVAERLKRLHDLIASLSLAYTRVRMRARSLRLPAS
jgi:hypothetical protein